ncbi:MAG: hypothetical protein GWM98_04665 [Nitrospinaceae bacterium]|nr:hypothetical protein [Deltaproteobacteria bacterium]NIY14212.1 hypothetical protein [Nitrospinaceae bacterium]
MNRDDMKAEIRRLKEIQNQSDEPDPAGIDGCEFRLEEIERLKIVNLSLEQELLFAKKKELEQEMGRIMEAVRVRLNLPQRYDLAVDPRRGSVRAMLRKKEEEDGSASHERGGPVALHDPRIRDAGGSGSSGVAVGAVDSVAKGEDEIGDAIEHDDPAE